MNKANSRAIELTESDFVRFADFRPTAFDCRGLGVPDEQAEWLVVPMAHQPKIADLMEISNWEAVTKTIREADPDGTSHDTHYFGHWTSDFEIIVVRPGSAAHQAAAECMCALADYPVLDEIDLSAREYEAQCEAITDALRPLTIEDGGVELDAANWDGFVECVFDDLWDNDQSAMKYNGGGVWISRETIESALTRLGYCEVADEISTWAPLGELSVEHDLDQI